MVKVGDIVKTYWKRGNKIVPAVVTNIYTLYGKINSVDVLFSDGANGNRSVEIITETGRHIDMQSVLDSIR